MKPFTLQLQDSSHREVIENVTGFVGEDSSGSFSLLADHARFVTVLSIGLARFRIGDSQWRYLAVPGGVLYFHNNCLTLSCRRYLVDDDYHRISDALQQRLLAEEDELHAMKESLQQLEDEFLRRMWEVSQRGGSPLL